MMKAEGNEQNDSLGFIIFAVLLIIGLLVVKQHQKPLEPTQQAFLLHQDLALMEALESAASFPKAP